MDVDTSDEMIAKMQMALPFADNDAGLHETGLLISMLQVERNALRDACAEFVRKCESGEARSKRSYAEMKAALDICNQHSPTPPRPHKEASMSDPIDWIDAAAKSGFDPRDLPEELHDLLKSVFHMGATVGVNASSDYMKSQYGICALDNEIDRARLALPEPPTP